MAAYGNHAVLFGGLDSNGVILGDTWIWDGATWTAAPTQLNPPNPRIQASAAAYQNGVLLFGGDDTVTIFPDTWFWDGMTWSPLRVQGPMPRYASAMTTL